MRAMPRDAGERSPIHPRLDTATHARRRLARYRESEQGTREDGTEAPAATAATAAGRRLVAEMPKEVPHEVRHLLAGADWTAPNCKARAAKTLEQIIQVRPACWSPMNPGARVAALLLQYRRMRPVTAMQRQTSDICESDAACLGRAVAFLAACGHVPRRRPDQRSSVRHHRQDPWQIQVRCLSTWHGAR